MLNLTEKERYKRHIALANFGEEQQLKLKKSKVLCIGAGGLGSPLLMYLTSAGIGTIGIMDSDIVELSNLQRQMIHLESNVGQLKTHSAKALLEKMNNNCSFRLHNMDISSEDAQDIFAQYDIIAVCVDNLQARYRINELSIKYKKPQISSFVVGYEGYITCFKPHIDNKSPCYQCLQPKSTTDCVKKASDIGVLAPLVGVLGCYMGIEVIRELLGWDNSLNGKVKVVSAINHDNYMIQLNKTLNCICSLV